MVTDDGYDYLRRRLITTDDIKSARLGLMSWRESALPAARDPAHYQALRNMSLEVEIMINERAEFLGHEQPDVPTHVVDEHHHDRRRPRIVALVLIVIRFVRSAIRSVLRLITRRSRQ